MKTDELILEIIEKVHEQGQITARKVDELQIEQVRHGELHRYNANNLEKHMARTESNEALIEVLRESTDERLKLLEKRSLFVDFTIKAIAVIGSIILFAIKVIPFLSRLI